MSKRKYNVELLNDEDEEDAQKQFSGLNIFKKTKAASNQVIIEKDENEQALLDLSSNSSNIKASEGTVLRQPTSQQNIHSNKTEVTHAATSRNFRGNSHHSSKIGELFVLPPMPKTPEKITPKNSNSIIVNPRQRGNPILKFVRNIPWEYGEIIPDYEIGKTSCALFLSMRYHNLNPEYIQERLKKLGTMYDLRVLLVQADVVNCKPSLKELGKVAMYNNLTMVLAWSFEEAGRYLETYKSYELKPPDILQHRVESDHLSKVQDFLTTIKSVNKTDVLTLLSTFGSVRNIVNATKQEIGDCPGIGSQKATRLFRAFNAPFKQAHNKPTSDDKPEPRQSKLLANSATKLPDDCPLKRPEELLTLSQREKSGGKAGSGSSSNLTGEQHKVVEPLGEGEAKNVQNTIQGEARLDEKIVCTALAKVNDELDAKEKAREQNKDSNKRTGGKIDETKSVITAPASSPTTATATRISKGDALHSYIKSKGKNEPIFVAPNDLSMNDFKMPKKLSAGTLQKLSQNNKNSSSRASTAPTTKKSTDSKDLGQNTKDHTSVAADNKSQTAKRVFNRISKTDQTLTNRITVTDRTLTNRITVTDRTLTNRITVTDRTKTNKNKPYDTTITSSSKKRDSPGDSVGVPFLKSPLINTKNADKASSYQQKPTEEEFNELIASDDDDDDDELIVCD